jgi:uroporphyrin-3 C-methyltransferase
MDEIIADETAARPRRRVWPLLLALLVVAALGVFAWWRFTATRQQQPDAIAAVQERVDALTRAVATVRGNTDTVRARLDDGEKVDASVRQQLLALSERLRLAEDALANQADRRLSGHDAQALDEAEFLLAMAAERFRLFHDVPATIAAYRLADGILAGVDDAVFSTVRQSLSGEITALGELHAGDPAVTAASLLNLIRQIRQWPVPVAPTPPAVATGQPASRLARLFGAFVQVRHDDTAPVQNLLRDTAIDRDLVVLDLRTAQAAALARDDAALQAALADARAQITATYDVNAAAVAAALHEMDTLATTPLAPAPPAALGASLRELRNLRATHALSTTLPPQAQSGEVKK